MTYLSQSINFSEKQITQPKNGNVQYDAYLSQYSMYVYHLYLYLPTRNICIRWMYFAFLLLNFLHVRKLIQTYNQWFQCICTHAVNMLLDYGEFQCKMLLKFPHTESFHFRAGKLAVVLLIYTHYYMKSTKYLVFTMLFIHWSNMEKCPMIEGGKILLLVICLISNHPVRGQTIWEITGFLVYLCFSLWKWHGSYDVGNHMDFVDLPTERWKVYFSCHRSKFSSYDFIFSFHVQSN